MNKGNWNYITEGIKAAPHSPIYKIHKYFARRPHNVFKFLVENYTRKGDTILDPFCGGGVTLIEGMSLRRRVVACDINPLATFISLVEATKVDLTDYLSVIFEIRDAVADYSKELFTTTDRNTGKPVSVRWFEHAYTTNCPSCGKTMIFSNKNKKAVNDTIINGWYICPHCGGEVQAVAAAHTGSKMLTVTYKVTTRATQKTVTPDESDLAAQEKANKMYDKALLDGSLKFPDVRIPVNWDRQQEDCLIRKGVLEFKDFFTKRSLLVMAYFLQLIKEQKSRVTPEMYRLLLLTFSATLRYTNNMTISTDSWQDGRPVAWAKHAYWLSNQYVEVNPIEYIDKRITAVKAALKQQKEWPDAVSVKNSQEFTNTPNSFWVLNQDSSHLPLDDESVDLVLTDPPYGGNVQYGELSAFWLSWIYDELGLSKSKILDLSDEILTHRKNKVNAKTYQTYYAGLNMVFRECYRVLKKGQPLVFTFNSKNAKVWMAVIKAVLDAGFILEPQGVIYQSPIENYMNTAHTKYAGTIHGDFIYTFVKPENENAKAKLSSKPLLNTEIKKVITDVITGEIQGAKPKTTSDIYIAVLRQLVPLLASHALTSNTYDAMKKIMSGNAIEAAIRSALRMDRVSACWTGLKEDE